ncbi:alpha/beta hydrolase [Aureococcus anophagefferens]|nr:alpha/beta hydrolase [Aureococcus anophagefferens]
MAACLDAAPTVAAYGSHPSQYVVVHAPRGAPRRVVVAVVHGGFWKNKYTVACAAHETLAPHLAARGYGVVEVEYRRRDCAGGGWPGTVDDVAAALDAARARPRRRRPAVVVGHSAGGHGALLGAARCAVAPDLVVAVAPVADMVACHERRLSDEATPRGSWGGARPTPGRLAAACPTRSGLAPLLARSDLLVATGDADDDVPPDLSRSPPGAALAPGRPRHVEVPGADHRRPARSGAARGKDRDSTKTAPGGAAASARRSAPGRQRAAQRRQRARRRGRTVQRDARA